MRLTITLVLFVSTLVRSSRASSCSPYAGSNEQLFGQLGRASIRSAHAIPFYPVTVDAVIDEKGRVISVHACDGPRGAFREAEAAERKLTFKPATSHGRPRRVSFTDTVSVFPLERWCRARQSFPIIHDWSTVRVTLERRNWCFEPSCTAYLVTINGKGEVELSKYRFAFVDPGHFVYHISPEKVRDLLNDVEKADFFSMCGSYVPDAAIKDAYGEVISVWTDGHETSVAEYDGREAGAPDALSYLADQIDQLAGTHDRLWQKR